MTEIVSPGTSLDSTDDGNKTSRSTWVRILRRPDGATAVFFLVLILFLALFGPLVAPFDPRLLDMGNVLQGPSLSNWLGTDNLGRDIVSRLIYGAQTAVITSLQSVGLALLLGGIWGTLAGYLGGVWDLLLSRLADILQSISGLLLALVLVAILGNSLSSAMLALGILFSVGYMRLTRALVLSERQKLYVSASEIAGVKPWRIALQHVFPNIIPPLIVHTSIMMGLALLLEATLSFIGIGGGLDQISWGSMLNDAKPFAWMLPLQTLAPGLVLTAAILLFNVFGDIARDEFSGTTQPLSPRKRRKLAGGAPKPLSGSAFEGETAATTVADMVDADPASAPILEVRGLTIDALHGDSKVELLSDVSFDINKGEVFGLVGESGCGKSITAMAVLGLLPDALSVRSGSVSFGGTELVGMKDAQLNTIRGKRIGYVSQDPMGALSPVHTIGRQLADPMMLHLGLTKKQARARAIELLDMVGVPNPSERIDSYPFQFSGGMAQRVVIAGAISCEPELIIADEPTTALDVTVQFQVLELLRDLGQRLGTSMLLITHDLGVIADTCDRVGVMYAGRVVEVGTTTEIFNRPRHPYSKSLLLASERRTDDQGQLATIEGRVPPPWARASGCRFNPRCDYATERCTVEVPQMIDGVECLRADELNLEPIQRGGHDD